MKHASCFFIIFGFLFYQTVSAQEKIRFLKLDETIELAKLTSPDALNARQNFRASFWEFRSYRASNLPSLVLNSTLPYLKQTFSQVPDTAGILHNVRFQTLSTNASLSLTQQIGITGGSISINSYLSGLWNQNGENSSPYLSTPVNLVLDQPLFKYNSFKWEHKLQPLKYSQAKRKYLENIEQISITATTHFFDLLQAQIEKKIALVNLSNYDTMYNIAKGRFQLGKIAENDLLQMELDFLKAQAAVENANMNLENAQFRFKSYLRLQDTTHVVLIAPEDFGFFTINPATAINRGIEYSTASLDYKQRRLEAASQVNRAKMENRFDANIHAELGLSSNPAATVPDAYKKPVDNRVLQFGLTIPIVDWGVAHGKIKIAQSQQEVVKNSVEQDSIDYRQNVYLKAVQFNMQKNQVRIAAKSDTVARKSFEVTKGRYLIGKINSILDLNNAQIETDNAEKGYYSALQAFYSNYFEIRKLTLYDFRLNKPLEFDFNEIK